MKRLVLLSVLLTCSVKAGDWSSSIAKNSEVAKLLNSSASPTRRGPLVISETTESVGVFGPVKTLVIQSFLVGDKGGKIQETWRNTQSLEFNKSGQVVLNRYVNSDYSEIVEKTYRYEKGRLIESKVNDGKQTLTSKYIYDSNGNLSLIATYNAEEKLIAKELYQAFPNGYVEIYLDGEDNPKQITYVLQNSDGHDINNETFDTAGTRLAEQKTTYEGKQIKRVEGGFIMNGFKLIYENNKVVESIGPGGGIRHTFEYSGVDKYGNHAVESITQFISMITTGGTNKSLVEVRRQGISYYE